MIFVCRIGPKISRWSLIFTAPPVHAETTSRRIFSAKSTLCVSRSDCRPGRSPCSSRSWSLTACSVLSIFNRVRGIQSQIPTNSRRGHSGEIQIGGVGWGQRDSASVIAPRACLRMNRDRRATTVFCSNGQVYTRGETSSGFFFYISAAAVHQFLGRPRPKDTPATSTQVCKRRSCFSLIG